MYSETPLNWTPQLHQNLSTLSIPKMSSSPKSTYSYINNTITQESHLNRTLCLVPREYDLKGFHCTYRNTETTSSRVKMDQR